MSHLKEPDQIEVIDLEEYTECGKPIPKHVIYYLIKVNQEKFRVQSPTSAREILILADDDPCAYHVEQKFKGQDSVILELDQPIDLTEPGIERFITVQTKTISIIINGRAVTVDEKKLSFDELIRLAFDTPPTGENICITVTYRNGPRKNPEGMMIDGDVVKLKSGMVFNVTATDKS